MHKCNWWKLCKTDKFVKQHLREPFSYKRPLREGRLLENLKSGGLFGYVDSDFEVPRNLREAFAIFPPIFKIKNVGRDDIRPFMRNSRGRRTFDSAQEIANFKLFLGEGNNQYTVATFLSELELVCKNNYRFVQYTPIKRFNKFVQSAVNAKREGDDNPNFSDVAETLKLQANISLGYQIMNWSQHTVTKYLSDEKTHGAITNKMFKRPGYINDQLYDVELHKSEIEHKDPIYVGFFILRYAKLRMLEL